MKNKKMNTIDVVKEELSMLNKNTKYTGLYITLFALAGGILPVVASLIPKIIIDYLTNQSSSETVVKAIIFLSGASLILSVISAVFNRLASVDFMGLRLKEYTKVTRKYQLIDYKYLEDSKFRDYFETATIALDSDNRGFEGLLNNFLRICPLFITIIALAVLLSFFNLWIVLACLLSASITVLTNKIYGSYVSKRKEESSKKYRQKDYYSRLAYDFSYGKEIRVHNLEKKLSKDYQNKSITYIKVVKDIANKKFGLRFLELLFVLFQDAIAYYLVIRAYFIGDATLGEVSFYIGAIIVLSTSLRSLADLISLLVKNASYSKTYFEYASDNKYFSERGILKALPEDEKLEIEFKNVSFRYPNTENYVLKNFNFTIHKGEKLALVGLNGAGKTTIVKLITGLFQVDEGEILINGININEFDKEEYKKMFASVYQEVNIYAATILENVIGTDKTEDEIQRGKDCLLTAGLGDKINSLENGYDTQLLKVVEDNGTELSGGESQKVAIARALYKGGNMVILDEPTSALDALAEAKIYESFNSLTSDKTSLFISHRLSSTKFCDKIALFSKEGLKEYGTHDELMAMKGDYYNMFETQGKYYKEGVEANE